MDESAVPLALSFRSGFGDGMEALLCDWDTVDLSSATPTMDNLFEIGLGSGSTPGTSAMNFRCQVSLDPYTGRNTSSHDCEARAVSILGSLQHGRLQEGATTCATNAVPYADVNLAPGFDQVIAVNRAALSGWSKLMACHCAQCPHLTLLYVSILTKVLFWYRIAAARITPSQNAEKTDNSGVKVACIDDSRSTNRNLNDGAPAIDRFSVRPIQVQVGVLNLDAEEQATMCRELLLRELHRTDGAIDKLLNLDRACTEDELDEMQRHLRWSLSGVSLVREQLQEVMQMVQHIG
jgi:hypothetical protein